MRRTVAVFVFGRMNKIGCWKSVRLRRSSSATHPQWARPGAGLLSTLCVPRVCWKVQLDEEQGHTQAIWIAP